jgi:hypothetical protein
MDSHRAWPRDMAWWSSLVTADPLVWAIGMSHLGKAEIDNSCHAAQRRRTFRAGVSHPAATMNLDSERFANSNSVTVRVATASGSFCSAGTTFFDCCGSRGSASDGRSRFCSARR